MNKSVSVIGAGMSGLISAIMLNQYGFDVTVYEQLPKLPKNHSALLRFKTDKVSKATAIPFRKVKAIKSIYNSKGKALDALAYSKKCSGYCLSDRSITEEIGERFISPVDFVDQLYERATSCGVKFIFNSNARPPSNIVSTIPLLATIGLAEKYYGPSFLRESPFAKVMTDGFRSIQGINMNAELAGHFDCFISLYMPRDTMWNRVSITGNRLTAEYSHVFGGGGVSIDEKLKILDPKLMIKELSMFFSELFAPWEADKITFTISKNQKILPVNDDSARKSVLAYLSNKFNIYSVGRFATWRPGLLLDDIPNDIDRIADWIKNGKYI